METSCSTGATPFRRPLPSNIPEPSPATGKAPWTATRCNRLLRPLTSRLAILEKQCLTHPGIGPSISCIAPVELTKASSSHNARTIEDRSTGQNDSGDPEWLHKSNPTKITHTYSARQRKALLATKQKRSARAATVCSSPAPGFVAVATPILSRGQRQNSVEDHGICLGEDDSKAKAGDRLPRKRKWRALDAQSVALKPLRKVTTPSAWLLYEGFYSAYNSLLGATTSTRPATKFGAKTLFYTCLRKVPSFIKAVEDEQKALAQATSTRNINKSENMTSAIYEDLQGMGDPCRPGWHALKDVVRVHGTCLIAHALKDSILPSALIQALIDSCVQHSAHDEAEVLLSSLPIETRLAAKPKSPRCRLFDGSVSIALQMLDTYAGREGRRGFLFRQLTLLLSHDQLHPTWIATRDFVTLWSSVIQSISEGDVHCQYAWDLLLAAMTASATFPRILAANEFNDHEFNRFQEDATPTQFHLKGSIDDALQNTVSSLTATIVAVSTGSQNGDKHLSQRSRRAASLLRCLTIRLDGAPRKINSKDVDKTLSNITISRRIIIFLGAAFVSLNLQNDPSNAGTKPFSLYIHRMLTDIAQERSSSTSNLPSIADMESNIISLTEFMCCSAKSCERVKNECGFQSMQHWLDNIIAFLDSTDRLGTTDHVQRSFLARVSIQATFDYAEKLGRSDQLAWAAQIDGVLAQWAMPSGKASGMGPQNDREGASEFRWEEGICEWIRATPAKTTLKSCQRRAQNSSYQDWADGDAPFTLDRLAADFTPYARKTPRISRMLLGESPLTGSHSLLYRSKGPSGSNSISLQTRIHRIERSSDEDDRIEMASAYGTSSSESNSDPAKHVHRRCKRKLHCPPASVMENRGMAIATVEKERGILSFKPIATKRSEGIKVLHSCTATARIKQRRRTLKGPSHDSVIGDSARGFRHEQVLVYSDGEDELAVNHRFLGGNDAHVLRETSNRKPISGRAKAKSSFCKMEPDQNHNPWSAAQPKVDLMASTLR